MYALGLPAYGLYKILVPTFYALDRQKIPVLGSLFSIGFNIAFCLLLTPLYGFKILALGTTLSVLVNAVFQSWILKKDLALSWGFFFSRRIFKVLAATIATGILVETFLKPEFFSQPFITKCVTLTAQISSVGILYATFLVLMGERSAMKAISSKITKKLARK